MNNSIFHQPWYTVSNRSQGSISEFYVVHETKDLQGNLLFIHESSETSSSSSSCRNILKHIVFTEGGNNIDDIHLLIVPKYHTPFPLVDLLFLGNPTNPAEGLIQLLHEHFSTNHFLETESLNDLTTEVENQNLLDETHGQYTPTNESFKTLIQQHRVSTVQLTGNESLQDLLEIPNVLLLSKCSAETSKMLHYFAKVHKQTSGDECAVYLPSLLAFSPERLASLHCQLVVHVTKRNPLLPCKAKLTFHRFHDASVDIRLFQNDEYYKSMMKRVFEEKLTGKETRIIPHFTHTPLVTVLLKTRNIIRKATVTEARHSNKLTFQLLEKQIHDSSPFFIYYLETACIYQTIQANNTQPLGAFYLSADLPIEIEWEISEDEDHEFSVIYLVFDSFVSTTKTITCYSHLQLALMLHEFTPLFDAAVNQATFQQTLSQVRPAKMTESEYYNLSFEIMQSIDWQTTNYKEWQTKYPFQDPNDNQFMFPMEYKDYAAKYDDLYPMPEPPLLPIPPTRNTANSDNSRNRKMTMNMDDSFTKFLHLQFNVYRNWVIILIAALEFLNKTFTILPKEERVCAISLEPIGWFSLFYKCNVCRSVYRPQYLWQWAIQSSEPFQNQLCFCCPNCKERHVHMMKLYCHGPSCLSSIVVQFCVILLAFKVGHFFVCSLLLK